MFRQLSVKINFAKLIISSWVNWWWSNKNSSPFENKQNIFITSNLWLVEERGTPTESEHEDDGKISLLSCV
jgi:hypothetical protein